MPGLSPWNSMQHGITHTWKSEPDLYPGNGEKAAPRVRGKTDGRNESKIKSLSPGLRNVLPKDMIQKDMQGEPGKLDE